MASSSVRVKDVLGDMDSPHFLPSVTVFLMIGLASWIVELLTKAGWTIEPFGSLLQVAFFLFFVVWLHLELENVKMEAEKQESASEAQKKENKKDDEAENNKINRDETNSNKNKRNKDTIGNNKAMRNKESEASKNTAESESKEVKQEKSDQNLEEEDDEDDEDEDESKKFLKVPSLLDPEEASSLQALMDITQQLEEDEPKSEQS